MTKLKLIIVLALIPLPILASKPKGLVKLDKPLHLLKTPIPDADPSIRESRGFRLPCNLLLQSNHGSLTLSTDSTTLKDTTIEVGLNMVVGFYIEIFAITSDDRMFLFKGTSPKIFGLVDSTNFSEHQLERVVGSAAFVIEVVIRLFETDIPPQYMWSLKSDEYKVLWSDTLRTAVIQINKD